MADYAENICQAVDEILRVRLEQLGYDITIKCTIVDDSTACLGWYEVHSGQTTFTAYSHLTNLKVNDMVYVLIPCHNYNESKFIIGVVPKELDENNSVSKSSVILSTDNIANDTVLWRQLHITWNRVIDNKTTQIITTNVPEGVQVILYSKLPGENYEIINDHLETLSPIVTLPNEQPGVTYKVILQETNQKPLESNELTIGIVPEGEITQAECLAWVAKKIKEEKEAQT